RCVARRPYRRAGIFRARRAVRLPRHARREGERTRRRAQGGPRLDPERHHLDPQRYAEPVAQLEAFPLCPSRRRGGAVLDAELFFVTPAKAGVQRDTTMLLWIPA